MGTGESESPVVPKKPANESPEELVDRVAQWRQRIMGLSFVHELEPEID